MAKISVAESAAEWIPVEELRPWKDNPRINDQAVANVVDSIKRFGFGAPLIARKADREVIAGHTRLKAAIKLGLTHVPVRFLDLDPVNAHLLALADNKTAELAEWDDDALGAFLEQLRTEDIDLLTGTGFSSREIDQLIRDTQGGGTEGVDPGATEPPKNPVSRFGEVYELGPHRLMCGSSIDADNVQLLMNGERAVLMATDPPYLVDYDGTNHPQSFDREHAGKSNNKKWDAYKDPTASIEFFSTFIRLGLQHALVENPAIYQWHASKRQSLVEAAWTENGLLLHQQIIWSKSRPILTRSHFMWQHEPCQPPGTMVRVPAGKNGRVDEVPIETLNTGDCVVAWDPNSHALYGKRGVGVPIQVGARHYQGELYGVSAGGRKTWCTDGHQWTTRFSPEARQLWAVYLMRRGPWWRVGVTRLMGAWGCGVKARMISENGEAAWVLSTHPSAASAQFQEQFISVRYGIPTTYRTTKDMPASRWRPSNRARVAADIEGLYDRLDLAVMEMNARRALCDHGRSLKYPFTTSDNTREKYGTRNTIILRACNLLAGAMVLPVPRGQSVEFVPIEKIERKPYVGEVFSLDVQRFQHYIADGLITHNCFYGWVEGKQPALRPPVGGECTTIWTIDQAGEQDGIHPTQKPLEIFERPIAYHTQSGDLVYEPFSGSGSQLIAAAKLGRRCYAMELEPAFVDVARIRWTSWARSAGVDPGPGALDAP